MKTYIPQKHRRVNSKPLWSTRNVARLSRLKQRYWNTNLNNPSVENFNRYKQAETECKRAVRSAKRRFERKLATDGNRRPFHAYVRTKTKHRTNVGPLKVQGKIVSSSIDMAGVLNQFFSSVFSSEDNSNIPTEPRLPCNEWLDNMNFEKHDVLKKIEKLKPCSAPGPDGISAHILQNFKAQFTPALTIIFNKSFQSGTVPIDWRIANVTPIFKKGLKGDPGNYRPVSLTSIPCKIMEALMKDKMVDHLVHNQLIQNTQHGFMSKKSCLTNLLEFLEQITSETDDGKPIDIIYLDFAKAFDKVPKNRLLSKIKAHSISGRFLGWIESWLTGRKQRVVLNGNASSWADVLSGVPQGSVLGPLAFIIFINSIDQVAALIALILKFADDTKLANSALTATDRVNLQKCLDDVCEWAEIWGMEFNVKKCKVMHLGRTNIKQDYFMNGHKLEQITEEKDLGVIFQDTLKPSKQCSEAAKNANFALGQITRAFHYRDRKIFLSLYKQFVRPHLEYSTPAWSPWLLGEIETLERVQRRAVKQITGLQSTTYEGKLKELGIQTLKERRIRSDMITTYKILKGYVNVNPETWFQQVGNQPLRHTRLTMHPLNLLHKNSKTEARKNSFSVRIPPTWNNLPNKVKDSTSIESFKYNYDKFCMEAVDSY